MDSYDTVIVGGGIAGGALATVLARAGKRVLVLEKSTVYRDLVRGEWIAPWGVIESQRLGLYDTLMAAGGHHVASHVEFGEDIDPDEAAKAPLPLAALLPGVPGPLCIGHPAACNALDAAAREAGAAVLRGVNEAKVHPGPSPTVAYEHEGEHITAGCRLIVGADGRNSSVRPQLGIELHRDPQHHWFTGMLVEGVPEWPAELQTMGTQGDIQFFVFPQGEGRLRLYLSYPTEQRSRLSGDDGPRRFLEAFRIPTLPHSEAITAGRIAGPCNSVPNSDTWTDTPYVEGAVLVGDAAGHNDPIIGQGLSISLRDARIVSEALLATDDWDAARLFAPYAGERAERMRRLRFAAALDSVIHAEFGEAARRRRIAYRAARGANPLYPLAIAAVMVGPEQIPPEAFDDSVREEIVSLG